MPNITVSVSEDLKRRMDALDTVNWSGVARQAIEKHLTSYERFRELTKHSEMTEQDALELGRIVNEGMAKRINKEIEELRAKGEWPAPSGRARTSSGKQR